MLVYSVWHVFLCVWVYVCECVRRRFAVCNLHFKRQICRIHTYSTNIYIYIYWRLQTHTYTHIHTLIFAGITSQIRDRGPPSPTVEWGEQWSTCKFTFISAQKPSHTHTHTHTYTHTRTYMYKCMLHKILYTIRGAGFALLSGGMTRILARVAETRRRRGEFAAFCCFRYFSRTHTHTFTHALPLSLWTYALPLCAFSLSRTFALPKMFVVVRVLHWISVSKRNGLWTI